MAYVKHIFDKNFLEYASYVIKDRAIPDLEDGLKPVQRRIMHTLFEMDDGKFHKVANVVGQVMKYHPHGDASIAGALIVLANKEIFIEKQGNFGNIYTGDGASAPRYIECRLKSIAKIFYIILLLQNTIRPTMGEERSLLPFAQNFPWQLFWGRRALQLACRQKS